MKKQILSIGIFLLTVFAGVNQVKAQTTSVAGTAPKAAPTGCDDSPLAPMAGKPYEYEVSVNPTGGNYIWWATKDANFIVNGVLNNTTAALGTTSVLSTVAADYNASTTSNKVELTWDSNVLAGTTSASPTFVAVHYDAGCTDNFKVYEINPINAFIVDILNLNPVDKSVDTDAYGYEPEQCFDEVQGASWSSGGMVYDYGTNVLYYEVVAAYFTNSWTPTFTIAGLDAAQGATIEWAYDKAFTSPVTVASGTASTTPVVTNVTDTQNGVSIYVRVTVDNNTFEGLADQTLALSVTGTNTAGERDVVASDCSTADVNTASQVLNSRPTVTSATDDGSGGTAAFE